MNEEFYRVCWAHECEFGSLGLDLVVGRAPEPLHRARGRSGVSLSFLGGPRASFLFGKRGVYRVSQALECKFGSLGLGLVAGRAPEPLLGARGDQEFPCLFCAALTHPFRSEGGVEYVRLPSVGMSSDTSGELLSGKSKWRPVPHSIGVGKRSRAAPQKYQRASLVGPRAVRLAPRARYLPMWDSIQRLLCRSRT